MGFHVDTLDVYAARQRVPFIKQAAQEIGIPEDVIRRDMLNVLTKLDELLREHISKMMEPAKEEKHEMSAEEKEASLELLRYDPQRAEMLW